MRDETDRGNNVLSHPSSLIANACGPCIGQWKREDSDSAEENSILSSFNRNFKARNDGNSKTMNFLASPELVTAMAFAGRLSFDPRSDSLYDNQMNEFKFAPPQGIDLPQAGFDKGKGTLVGRKKLDG